MDAINSTNKSRALAILVNAFATVPGALWVVKKDDKIKLPKAVKNIEDDHISVYKHLEIEYYVRLVEYIPGNLM